MEIKIQESNIEEFAKDIDSVLSLQASKIYLPTYYQALCLSKLGYQKVDVDSVVIKREVLDSLKGSQELQKFVKRLQEELYNVAKLYFDEAIKDIKNEDAINNYGIMNFANNVLIKVADEFGIKWGKQDNE